MKQFPESFLKCFTHSDDEVTPDKFLDLLDFPAEVFGCCADAVPLCEDMHSGWYVYIHTTLANKITLYK